MGRREEDDELVTRASAMVIHWFRNELKREIKKALKDIYWELWRDLFEYLYRANWFRLALGILTAMSAISIWLHEELK